LCCIRVEEHLVLAAQRSYLLDRLHHTNFVVYLAV
jgi:hypothetical protein